MLDHPAHLLPPPRGKQYQLVHETSLGALYEGDCLALLPTLPDQCVDLIFADPPFNLGKDYGKGISDDLRNEEYLAWSWQWLAETIRVLKPGGSLFVFNLPRWLIEYGAFLNRHEMTFRHWIACRMPKTFPRGRKLSPAHYGLLYYTKGEPATFNRVYVPIPVCRHCGGEIRDYGGHRDKLNEKGLNLMDVLDDPDDVWELNGDRDHPHVTTAAEDFWDDIPPVRHSKYKTRGANELAPIMLERIIALATAPHDLVMDPFGGSGTTYYAAEKLHRRWLGIEIGATAPAIQRLHDYANGHILEWESARGHNGHSHKVQRPTVVVAESKAEKQLRLFEEQNKYQPEV